MRYHPTSSTRAPRSRRLDRTAAAVATTLAAAVAPVATAAPHDEKTHFTYLWHMEQPIYWPDREAGTQRSERAWASILRTDAGALHPANDLRSIFGLPDRVAAYQWRPRDTVASMLATPEGGAQVSFSGGLVENLDSFSEAGGQLGYAVDWRAPWRSARAWRTSAPGAAAPRMDVVLFSHHHALLPLLDDDAVRKELALFRELYPDAFGSAAPMSRGFFPSEMAFSTRLIPLLAEAGIDWTFVSGEKLSRACAGFPVVFGSGGVNCDPPNRADQLNPPQPAYRRIAISRGCGPAEAAPFAYLPHRARHVDPATGRTSEVVVVPCSQHLGWLDGYAPLSTGELAALEPFNVDPARPMLVVLAHDGDNGWGSGFTYYVDAVPDFVAAAEAAGHRATVVEKYLADHPVPGDDVVHVEDGAWVNADGDFGSPQFLNWNWPPVLANGAVDVANGWAVDVRNWAVIVAAQNVVSTAEAVETSAGAPPRIAEILRPSAESRPSERAWHFFLASLNSGYMYYGTDLDMELKPTVACNEAILEAQAALVPGAPDAVAPTVWIPQRFPWNPGSVNFGPQHGYQQYVSNGDFRVWTFVHDVSGTASATLRFRLDDDGGNPLDDHANELYAGGDGVGAWIDVAMTRRAFPAGNVWNLPGIDFPEMPLAIAEQWHAEVAGVRSRLVDYYVEAVDVHGNVRRSPIQHVWVGDGAGSGGGGGGGSSVVAVTPDPLVAGQSATVSYDPAGRPLFAAASVKLHYGFNGWSQVASPDATMTWNASSARWTATVPLPTNATQFDFVFHDGAGLWDNNGGADWHVAVTGAPPPAGWTLDGVRDRDAVEVARNAAGTRRLWAGIKGTTLYVATEDAGEGDDVFAFVAESPGALRSAPWAKSGLVAAWSMFLADENDNAYEGWFNQFGNAASSAGNPQAATGPNGGVLEGTIELDGVFGRVPASIALAVGPYATANGGALRPLAQAPASANANGTLDAVEYATVETCAITLPADGAPPGTCCAADLDRNGVVDASDLGAVLAAWGTSSASADVDGSGVVDAADLSALLAGWGDC